MEVQLIKTVVGILLLVAGLVFLWKGSKGNGVIKLPDGTTIDGPVGLSVMVIGLVVWLSPPLALMHGPAPVPCCGVNSSQDSSALPNSASSTSSVGEPSSSASEPLSIVAQVTDGGTTDLSKNCEEDVDGKTIDLIVKGGVNPSLRLIVPAGSYPTKPVQISFDEKQPIKVEPVQLLTGTGHPAVATLEAVATDSNGTTSSATLAEWSGMAACQHDGTSGLVLNNLQLNLERK